MLVACRERRLWVALSLAVVLIAALITAVTLGRHDDRDPSRVEAAPSAVPATVVIRPGPDETGVDPLGAVTVSVADGVLTGVEMVNEHNKPIPGVLTPDNLMWKPSVALGYGRTYTLTVHSKGQGGAPASQVSKFTTLTPGNQTRASLTTTSGAALTEGGTYGVGTVIVARFDEPIVDRVAAERQLKVTTSPAVQGSWYWVDDQRAHWRPKDYYQPGTRITASADIYGVNLGDGLYGQADQRVSFTIGDAHVSIADDATKQVSVYENGRLVRTIPTSMGMGGTETIGGQQFSFWTQPGVYTVMDKANPVVMDSSTYGLPINSRLGYKETINYAVRLSTDGVYLHQLESTVWAQGNTNVSHGCLNVNSGNAQWFYDFSQPGDVVEVRNTGGQPLQIWQNGDWTVPWDQWAAGSALT